MEGKWLIKYKGIVVSGLHAQWVGRQASSEV